ncbi:hypothetical protein LRS11_18070 [Pseudomonas sp. J452]|uniref:hypothetical protein n=1 Tax=Pseudomonas sp. J452 TaxID=2898441 RepID=UPI0021AE1AC6|nr:hypothetical protein [Pseudomonas sp. J452]UUY07705.1 hypothetical protein LRS11_18070 [Pseudomonas sp. J452]
MIKIDRPRDSTPDGLVREGLLERRANRLAWLAKTKLSFTAYSSPAVRAHLTVIFGRKCVFCESLLAGTQSGDIEHFRPKGKVVIDPVPPRRTRIRKDGYYWLAASWPNLLIACADCNRPRTQLDYDARARVIGKASYFPLEDEATRAIGPRGLRNEAPLLLNPCIDDPEDHLVFLEDGRVEPAVKNGRASKKGEISIHYLGLARAELLQMRARHQRTVMAAIRHTVAALEEGRDPGADLDDLLTLLSPQEAYVAFTRMLVRKYMGAYLEGLGLGAS